MLLDDRPDYPMVFQGELTFIGEMQREPFDAALRVARLRHPLLAACVTPPANGPPAWIPAFDREPLVDWNRVGVPLAQPGDVGIDLYREPGLRIWIRVGEGETRMVAQTHHSCCDGHGGMKFLEDFLAAYADATAGDASGNALRPLDSDRLRQRGVFAAPPGEGPGGWRAIWGQMRDGILFHALPPAPLRPPRGRSRSANPVGELPGTCTHVFSDEASRRIRAAVANSTGTINDVALALLFETLIEWNVEQGAYAGEGRLRLLMPTDLRTIDDLSLPAANRMTFSFVTRRASQCGDRRRLLAGIRDETQAIRRTRLGLDFLHAVSGMLDAGLLPRVLRFNHSVATAVLSNMGDPTRRFSRRFPRDQGRCVVGNLVLDNITASPPLRPLTRGGFGIGMYAGKTIVTARCDPWLFTLAETQQILDKWVDRWQALAAHSVE